MELIVEVEAVEDENQLAKHRFAAVCFVDKAPDNCGHREERNEEVELMVEVAKRNFRWHVLKALN